MNSILNNKSILIVDDDKTLSSQLKTCLNAYNAQISIAVDLDQAYSFLRESKPHLVMLDRSLLHNHDGIELLRHVRHTPQFNDVAVIMLTAKQNEMDKELAHKYYADAYITKPFAFKDLIRRTEAILRRTISSPHQEIWLAPDLLFSPSDRTLSSANRTWSLSSVDLKLLECFSAKRGLPLSRDDLIYYLHEQNVDINPQEIDAVVARLKKNLKGHDYLVQGVGYKLLKFAEAEQLDDKQQSNEAERLALAGSIAHEMRNPLNKFSLLADLIQEKLSRNQLNADDIQEIAGLIKVTAKGANSVIDLILSNIANKEINKADFHILSVEKTIREALKLYPLKPGEQEIIHLDIARDFSIVGSGTLLHYVLFNLLKNALYYFPGHPHMLITISTRTINNFGYLLFKDTSVGIAEDKIKSIFSAFITLGKKNGTGLGLPFCKRVIESFGGNINCESELGKYTQFTMSFPMADQILPLEEQTTTKAVTKMQQIIPEHIDQSGLENVSEESVDQIVLLIEDESINRLLVKSLLADLDGIKLYFAEDGKKALQQVRSIGPDIILMDLNVPHLAGEELIDTILASDLNKRPVIISLSGNDPNKAIRAKLDDVLIKPVSKQDLIRKIQHYSKK